MMHFNLQAVVVTGDDHMLAHQSVWVSAEACTIAAQ